VLANGAADGVELAADAERVHLVAEVGEGAHDVVFRPPLRLLCRPLWR
jgi:hypothetical protein